MDIAALKEAAGKATPGGWSVCGADGCKCHAVLYRDGVICEVRDSHSDMADATGHAPSIEQAQDNKRFIALANPTAILSLIERQTAQQRALGVFAKWAIDVSTLGELADLEARMNAVGVTMQQVGEWSALSPTNTQGR